MAERHRVPIETDATETASAPEVAAVHHEAATDRWLFFCHGLRSDKSGSYEHRCQRAVEAGYNAVRFDSRGCGDADGEFVDSTLEARLADLHGVVDHFDPGAYTLFGSSFGGKVALHAAARDDRVRAVATRAPVTINEAFDEYRAVIDRDGAMTFDTGERIDGRFFDALDRHPFDEVVENLTVPVAIFHGGDDESVDPTDSFAAARRLETDVLVERFAGEGHRFSRAGEERLLDRLFGWLEWAETRG
ncbi:alpha/beta fold hydrolase [Natrinema sp. 1APR25-10V2]|uniref:alpha/beta hydrolase family protein n=1 Tax=Natrinema sp. 1APR25-10V2 TaxID=2951081 RepID=UPI002874ECC7|nr:alpha/beta fold hydrolase [Natrinema sp. 1APR25-10V2]MDS0475054.1 alpha/beta fold hydrolase [Natrinema sp. 1APR25-10V2]